MAKDPADRPSTAAGFVAELETAAVAAYGEDWEERGRRKLAALAALLPLLFRLNDPPGPAAGTTLFQTVLGTLRTRTAGVAVGAGLVVIAGGLGVYALAGDRSPQAQKIDIVAAEPSPEAAVLAPLSLPTPSTSPSVSASPDSSVPPPGSPSEPSESAAAGPSGEPPASQSRLPVLFPVGLATGLAVCLPVAEASGQDPHPAPLEIPRTVPHAQASEAGGAPGGRAAGQSQRAGHRSGLGLRGHREHPAGAPERGLPGRSGGTAGRRAPVRGDQLHADGQVRLREGGLRVDLERHGDRRSVRRLKRRERQDSRVSQANAEAHGHPHRQTDTETNGDPHDQTDAEAHGDPHGQARPEPKPTVTRTARPEPKPTATAASRSPRRPARCRRSRRRRTPVRSRRSRPPPSAPPSAKDTVKTSTERTS